MRPVVSGKEMATDLSNPGQIKAKLSASSWILKSSIRLRTSLVSSCSLQVLVVFKFHEVHAYLLLHKTSHTLHTHTSYCIRDDNKGYYYRPVV